MKKRIGIMVLLISGIALVSNCKKEETVVEASPTFDLTAAKTSIDAGYREFENAFNSKDSVGLGKCYATDAKFMPPNDKAVEGRAAIQKAFGQWMKGDNSPKIACKLMNLWGDDENVTAENAWTMTGADGKVVDEGKSIEVYKMEDGKWRLYRDCFNSDMPTMAPAK